MIDEDVIGESATNKSVALKIPNLNGRNLGRKELNEAIC